MLASFSDFFDDTVAATSSRLVAAVLAEQHDDWAEGRRHLGLDVLARAQATAPTSTEVGNDLTLQALTE